MQTPKRERKTKIRKRELKLVHLRSQGRQTLAERSLTDFVHVQHVGARVGAHAENRTPDLALTKGVLYH